jgi:hypothetical protein
MKVYKYITLTILMCGLTQSNGMRWSNVSSAKKAEIKVNNAYNEFDSLKSIERVYDAQLISDRPVEVSDSIKNLISDSLTKNK